MGGHIHRLIHVGMSGIGSESGSPRAASQRFIKFISSDWEWLIRAPSVRRSLFVVCDSISAVISTAWAWCIIIPCMNCTSAGERGGSVALVVAGNVRVGWPGAPGCTMTGAVRSVCWAHTGSTKKTVRVVATSSPLRPRATALTERTARSRGLSLRYKDFIEFEFKYWGFQFITRRNRGHLR
jgi:hypothetical protein